MNVINVEVITPDNAAYKGEVESITIPGTSGSFQVLYNHAPLMSTFEVGVVKLAETGGQEKKFATGGGTVEVRNNTVLILAESFEEPEKIDVDRAEKAKERALDRLAHRSRPDIDEVRAELALRRAMNRLKVHSL